MKYSSHLHIQILTFLLTIFCSSLFADEGPSSLVMLEEKLGLDSVPADHIIVVDLSGSMNWAPVPGSRTRARSGARRYDFVLNALPDLLNAIPEGHYIQILGFHDDAVGEDNPQLLRANWGASSADISGLMSDIRSNLNIGNDTDIGKALEAVHRVITRANHNRLQYVYMFTDGEHDPPAGSRFLSNSDGWSELSANWQGLFNTCGTENSDRNVLKIFMFGLFDVESAGVLATEGIATNQDQIQFLSFTDPQTLEASFSQTISNTRNSVVQASLETESRCGGWSISIDLPEGIYPPCTLFTTVQSNFEHLESEGSLRISSTGDSRLTCILLTTEVHLLPDESIVIPVTLDFEYTTSGLFKKQATSSVALVIETYETRLEPTLLNNAGFGRLADFDSTVCNSDIVFHYSDGKFSRWVLLIPALLPVFIAYFIYRAYPRSITGKLQWLIVPDEFELPIDSKISGTGVLRIDSSEKSIVKNGILPSSFIAILSKPDGLFGREVCLQVNTNSVFINGKKITKGTEIKLRRTCSICYNDDAIEIKLINIRSTN